MWWLAFSLVNETVTTQQNLSLYSYVGVSGCTFKGISDYAIVYGIEDGNMTVEDSEFCDCWSIGNMSCGCLVMGYTSFSRMSQASLLAVKEQYFNMTAFVNNTAEECLLRSSGDEVDILISNFTYLVIDGPCFQFSTFDVCHLMTASFMDNNCSSVISSDVDFACHFVLDVNTTASDAEWVLDDMAVGQIFYTYFQISNSLFFRRADNDSLLFVTNSVFDAPFQKIDGVKYSKCQVVPINPSILPSSLPTRPSGKLTLSSDVDGPLSDVSVVWLVIYGLMILGSLLFLSTKLCSYDDEYEAIE